MSVAQQISELLSLKRDGVLSAEDVAFAIRELRAVGEVKSEQKVASKKRSPKKVKASPVAVVPVKAVMKKSRPKIETSAERRARLKAAQEECQRADEEFAFASLSSSERAMEEMARGSTSRTTGKARPSTCMSLLTTWPRRGQMCS